MKASEQLRAEIAKIEGEFYAYQFKHIRHYGTHLLRLERIGEIERVRTEKMPHAGLPAVIYKVTKKFMVEKQLCMSKDAVRKREKRAAMRKPQIHENCCFTFEAWKSVYPHFFNPHSIPANRVRVVRYE